MSRFRPVALGQYARLFLLVLSEINLLLGVIFYLYPGMVIGSWPWPVKALAVRFLGAIFLAIAFGCWSALRAKIWQRAKILVLVGGAFFGLTSITTLSQELSALSGLVIWPWAGYFLAASAGCIILMKRYGWYRKPQDILGEDQPKKIARVFFQIQTVVVGVFGIMMLLLPEVAQQQFWPWRVAVPSLRTFGALFLASCLATGWASLQTDVRRIRVLLPLDAIFPSLALLAIGIDWRIIAAESPSGLVTAVWIGLYSFVAAGSTYLYFTYKPAW